jgi:hypothetical protein
MTGNISEVWTSLSGMHTVLGTTQRAPMFPMAAVCALVTTGTAVETITVADAVTVTIEAGFTLLDFREQWAGSTSPQMKQWNCASGPDDMIWRRLGFPRKEWLDVLDELGLSAYG